MSLYDRAAVVNDNNLTTDWADVRKKELQLNDGLLELSLF